MGLNDDSLASRTVNRDDQSHVSQAMSVRAVAGRIKATLIRLGCALAEGFGSASVQRGGIGPQMTRDGLHDLDVSKRSLDHPPRDSDIACEKSRVDVSIQCELNSGEEKRHS